MFEKISEIMFFGSRGSGETIKKIHKLKKTNNKFLFQAHLVHSIPRAPK
jgi:hypothetical protein